MMVEGFDLRQAEHKNRFTLKTTWSGAAVACRSYNPKVVCSNPTLAIKYITVEPQYSSFLFSQKVGCPNSATLEVISRILGHASVGITGDVYRTVRQDEIRDEHTRFSPLAGNI